MVDIFYLNKDSCQYAKVTDEVYNWCLSDIEACINPFGDANRLYTAAFDLFAAFNDLIGLAFFEVEVCYSDVEAINAYKRLIGDITSIKSTIFGFNYEWDNDRSVEHVTRKAFRKTLIDHVKEKGENHEKKMITDYLFSDFDLELEPENFKK